MPGFSDHRRSLSSCVIASELEIGAAIQGLGVIHSFEEYLRPAIVSGALEPVQEEWPQSFPGPFLYYPSRRYMPGPLRAFVNFIKEGRARGGDRKRG